MRTFLACLALLTTAGAHAGTSLPGPSGLLTVPTADVVDEGSVSFGLNRHGASPRFADDVNYLFSIGFAPGFEIGGRVGQPGAFEEGSDLSFNAKLRVWKFAHGTSIALGATDIGGEHRLYRSRYVVGTVPWHTLSFTAGHGWGQDVQEGTLAGIEWRPWSALGFYVEHDAKEINPGLRLSTPPLWGGLRIEANAGYHREVEQVEGGVQFTLPLGRTPAAGPTPRASAPLPVPAPAALRHALEDLGFESVRSGTRPDGTLVVALENRRYNHSTADGLGLALGSVATHAPAAAQQIEVLLTAYGVPQVAAGTSAQAWRDFLEGGAASPGLLAVHYSDGRDPSIAWDNSPEPLNAAELYVEPVLRTFVATEFGVLDAGAGVRARVLAPLASGLTAQVGLQAPIAYTDDFHDGRNFGDFAPEAGLDLLVAQYLHKLSPGWSSLWTVGLMQVISTDVSVLGNEQSWTSPRGRHRLHAKLMSLDSGEVRHNVTLGGYTWYDAARGYSAGLTGGRFYLDDAGVRLDLNRHFDDTTAGLFLKVENHDNMAGGFQLSFPLTPRRDAVPRGIQVKGVRRWGHSLQSTLNLADGTNQLKPLLLYEPMLDLDLRRDFLDSGRLGPDYLEDQLPRMREAWRLWGD